MSDGAGTVRIDLNYEKSSVRYWFSPDLEYRLVRLEVRADELSEPTWVYKYEWQVLDGVVQPKEIVLQVIDFPTRQGHHTHRLVLESLRAQCKVQENQFDLSLLDLSKATRIVDVRRPMVDSSN